MKQEELDTVIASLRSSTPRITYDTIYYLLAQLDIESRQLLEKSLIQTNDTDLIDIYRDAENGWREYGKSMGTISGGANELEHLKFHLGRIKYFSEPSAGFGTMGVPDYYGFGSRYWLEIKKQLYKGLCSDAQEYKPERDKLKEAGGNWLTIAIPAIMSVLGLPASMAGIAIVVSIFISKVGLNALCGTLKPDMDRLEGEAEHK
jgi:hypothetical protein